MVLEKKESLRQAESTHPARSSCRWIETVPPRKRANMALAAETKGPSAGNHVFGWRSFLFILGYSWIWIAAIWTQYVYYVLASGPQNHENEGVHPDKKPWFFGVAKTIGFWRVWRVLGALADGFHFPFGPSTFRGRWGLGRLVAAHCAGIHAGGLVCWDMQRDVAHEGAKKTGYLPWFGKTLPPKKKFNPGLVKAFTFVVARYHLIRLCALYARQQGILFQSKRSQKSRDPASRSAWGSGTMLAGLRKCTC